MRILLTTDTVGGVWTFTRELCCSLLERGHAVALVSFGREPSAEQREGADRMTAQVGDRFRFASSDTPLEWMTENKRAYSEGEQLLLRIADEFAPDLLHSNQFCFGAIPLRCPKLLTAHSDVLSWAAACRPNGLESSPWLDTYVRLTTNGLACADAVAAPTRWMLEALRWNFSLPALSRVIANGRRIKQSTDAAARKLQAVAVGRLWDEAKNISILAKVSSPVPLILAGEATFDNSQERVSRKMRNAGPLAEPELLRLFSESAIYIATSRYEPFGLAPLEAALCGCALIANDIPSLREVWGNDALYFHDAASLSGALKNLASDAQKLQALQHSCRRHALTYSRDRMTDGYLNLYSELTRRKHPLLRPIADKGELAAHVR